jgi:uncharacterized membrane protein YoaK (UPF0700 family)
MQRTESPLIALAILLAALAGFVDALAFTSLGGFFASFMSGNSTRLGVGLGSGSAYDAAIAASLVMSFVAGVILSSVVVRARPDRHQPRVMAIVTLLLTLAAVTAMVLPGPIVLLLLAAAMGAENGVFQRDGEVTIGLTYMTGALVRMGQKLAAALMGDPDRFGWVRYLGLWLGLVCGVVIGAESQFRWGWSALWLAPIFSAVLTLLLASMTRPRPARVG